MTNRGTDGFAESLVSGLLIGVLGAACLLSDVVIRMLVRVVCKYRGHRLMLGIGIAWAAALLSALVLATLPGLTTTAVCLALVMTVACVIAAAVSEIVLDQRAQSLDLGAEESFSDHLRGWWT